MLSRHRLFPALISTVAGILILASGCSDLGPTSVDLRPATALSAARAYDAGTYTAIIGPQGGILNFPIGDIVFPAGAVASDTRITATVDGRSLAVDFQPHLVFPAEALPTLNISFAGSLHSGNFVFYHFRDDGSMAERVPAVIVADEEIATVQTSSFSGWILAADRRP